MVVLNTRRDFLRMGLAAIAAPAIVRATSLMPIKAWFLGLDAVPDSMHLTSPSYEAAGRRMAQGLVESMRQTRLAVEERMIADWYAAEKMFDAGYDPKTVKIELKRSETGLWYGSHGL